MEEDRHPHARITLSRAPYSRPRPSRCICMYARSNPIASTVQTAQAISLATGARICVDPGLSEGPGHTAGWLPTLLERKRYFPEIDLSYHPLGATPEGEVADRDVVPRGVRLSRALSHRLEQQGTRGQVVLVTHASVALALTAAAAAGVSGGGGWEADVADADLAAVDEVRCQRVCVCVCARARARVCLSLISHAHGMQT